MFHELLLFIISVEDLCNCIICD